MLSIKHDKQFASHNKRSEYFYYNWYHLCYHKLCKKIKVNGFIMIHFLVKPCEKYTVTDFMSAQIWRSAKDILIMMSEAIILFLNQQILKGMIIENHKPHKTENR